MPSKAIPPTRRAKVTKPPKPKQQADKVNNALNLLHAQVKQLQLLVGSQANEITRLRQENAALRLGYTPVAGEEVCYQLED